MPTANEARQHCRDNIAGQYLKRYYDVRRSIEIISKEQFKVVNKFVCESVAANYKGEALDEVFKAHVEQLLEFKTNEVRNGSGNGAAGVAASDVPAAGAGVTAVAAREVPRLPAAHPPAHPTPPRRCGRTLSQVEAEARKRAREPSGEAEERPATRQQPGAQPEAQLGLTTLKQEGGVAPLMPSEAHRAEASVKEEGGLTAPPPPPPPPPPRNNIQPLQRGSAPMVKSLADLRDDVEQA